MAQVVESQVGPSGLHPRLVVLPAERARMNVVPGGRREQHRVPAAVGVLSEVGLLGREDVRWKVDLTEAGRALGRADDGLGNQLARLWIADARPGHAAGHGLQGLAAINFLSVAIVVIARSSW